ncbi:MAG: hypothetical protein PWR09_777 [Archaeoglobi archaeon]|nr:hypothetical protein [Candidatus Mnemosynella bozhongmuii]MDI3502652.1 hypothetical protein [Archaeoglobi archaeon]
MRFAWVFPLLVLLNYAVPYTLLAGKASPVSILFWSILIVVAIVMAFLSSMGWKDEE